MSVAMFAANPQVANLHSYYGGKKIIQNGTKYGKKVELKGIGGRDNR